MTELPHIEPYHPLEQQIMMTEAWQEGVRYGKPRRGHPEGAVIFHILEVLGNVAQFHDMVSEEDYRRLRLMVLLHDTFKYAVDHSQAKRGENQHAMIARRFSEDFTDDPIILDILEWHDYAYFAWRRLVQNETTALRHLHELVKNLGDRLNLYHIFFCCDTATGDKTQEPVLWFERVLQLPAHSQVLHASRQS